MDTWLESHRTGLTIAIVAVLAAGVVLWLQRAGDDRPLVIAVGSPTARPGGQVYVSGAVVEPGVYPFDDGDRVDRALALAGGPASDADLAAINLAVRLKDEQQVHVPSQREGRPPGTSPSEQPLLDLNLASQSELDALPGIGPVTAKRILDYRATNGPFVQVEDLKTAKLLNASVYEQVRKLVGVEPGLAPEPSPTASPR